MHKIEVFNGISYIGTDSIVLSNEKSDVYTFIGMNMCL